MAFWEFIQLNHLVEINYRGFVKTLNFLSIVTTIFYKKKQNQHAKKCNNIHILL